MNVPPDSLAPPTFPATHWSGVLRATGNSSAEAAAALELLCQTYWPPVYAFIRRRGHDGSRAQDLTQGFFARFLEKDYLTRADQTRGRFRSLLVSSVENYLHHEHERSTAQKRGGGAALVCLDAEAAELSFQESALTDESPAQAFEKRWASVLLEGVFRRLEREFAEGGKQDLFDLLQAHLWGDEEALPYTELAAQLHTSEAAVKMAALRLRRRFREILREDIAQTVATPDEVDDEIRHLMDVFSQ
jgi:RNA polymerase sigma-70 factor (ECF subfamily)